MGADIEELEDGMIIKGKTKLHGATIETFKDHRIAMSFSIADLVSDSRVILDDPSCINISFPGSLDLLRDLAKSYKFCNKMMLKNVNDLINKVKDCNIQYTNIL